MPAERKSGTILPSSLLAPTTRPEPVAPAAPTPAVEPEAEPVAVEQGGAEAPAAEARAPKARRRRASQAAAEKLEGRRLYLSEQVHFRLRMVAYQKGRKLSEVAEEYLDRVLPRFDVNRIG